MRLGVAPGTATCTPPLSSSHHAAHICPNLAAGNRPPSSPPLPPPAYLRKSSLFHFPLPYVDLSPPTDAPQSTAERRDGEVSAAY